MRIKRVISLILNERKITTSRKCTSKIEKKIENNKATTYKEVINKNCCQVVLEGDHVWSTYERRGSLYYRYLLQTTAEKDGTMQVAKEDQQQWRLHFTCNRLEHLQCSWHFTILWIFHLARSWSLGSSLFIEGRVFPMQGRILWMKQSFEFK